MKKIFNSAAVLILAVFLTAGFVSCSSPSGSSSSGDSGNGGNTTPASSSKVVIAEYKASTGYGTDYIIGYDDGTYDEKWNGEVWSTGTYEIKEGDMMNGSVVTTVTWAHANLDFKAGHKSSLTIVDGSFTTGNGYHYVLKGGKLTEKKKLITYKASINGGTDYVVIYNDETWVEIFSDLYVYSKGTYTITDGTIENGTVKLNVTWADPTISLMPGTYTVEIKNASFDFSGHTYKKK